MPKRNPSTNNLSVSESSVASIKKLKQQTLMISNDGNTVKSGKELWAEHVNSSTCRNFKMFAVTELMRIETLNKMKINKDGSRVPETLKNCYCPRPANLCKLHGNPTVMKKGSGYSNAYHHLVNCFGSEMNLVKEYTRAKIISASEGMNVVSCYDVASSKQEHKDMMAWIKFIIDTNSPLTCVENPSYREFSKTVNNFSFQRIKDVLINLNIHVEECIAKELKEAGRGAIMYDAWSKCGVHYIGLFACYNRHMKIVQNGVSLIETIPEITLTSVAPMLSAKDEETEDEIEQEIACQFNAELHAEHFRSIFEEFYGIDIEKWAVCCIADNTTTNQKTAKLLKIPHVGCENHLLNLDVKDWIENDGVLHDIVMKLKNILKEARTLKNTSMLQSLTHLKALLPNETRWSSVKIMIERFIKIHQHLVDLENTSDTFDMQGAHSAAFLSKCEKYMVYMNEIDAITVAIQKKCMSFEEIRSMMDELIRCSDEDVNSQGTTFYRCTFKPQQICLTHTRLHPDQHFEAGVVKIQRGDSTSLTDEEKTACKILEINQNHEETMSVDDESNDTGNSIVERVQRLRRQLTQAVQPGERTYGDCSFIFGSAAEVERLWSVAKHILTDERKGMMEPEMFEAFLFLKYNRRFWGILDVVAADVARLKKDSEENTTNQSGGNDQEEEDTTTSMS